MNLTDALSIKIGTADAVDVRLGSVSVWSGESSAAAFLTYESSSLGTIEDPDIYSRTISNPRTDFGGWNDSQLESTLAWYALNKDSINSSNTTEWLQIDLGEDQSVTGLFTQGAARYPNYFITKYRVEYCDEASIQFSVSGMASNTSSDTYFNSSNVGHYEANGTYNDKVQYVASGESDSVIRYNSSDDKWEFVNDGDEYYSSDLSGHSNPWSVRSWDHLAAGSGSAQSEIVLSVDQNTFTDVDSGAEFTPDTGKNTNFAAPVTARYVTIFPTDFKNLPMLRAGVLIDSVEVTLTPEFSGSSTVDWGDLNTDALVNNTAISHVFNPTYVQSTYNVTPANNVTSVDEGSALTLNVTTTNVADGTTLYYQITRDTDFSAEQKTGEFTINNGAGSFTITPTADETTESVTERFQVRIRTGNATGGAIVAVSNVIVINDTSLDSGPPTFTLSNNVSGYAEEGDEVEFTLTTNQTGTFNYTLVGSEIGGTPLTVDDFEAGTGLTTSLTGSFAGNGSTVRYKLKEDNLTEGTLTMVASITDTNGDGSAEATSIVSIGDTSTTPAFTPNFELTIGSPSTGLYSVAGTDQNGSVNANNPTLAFNQGDKVRFNNGVSSSHPLYITTSSGSISNLASGVSGAGTATVDWTIPSAGTYYYQCQVHSSMYGQITVT